LISQSRGLGDVYKRQTVAIETSKKVIMIEREACSELLQKLASEEDEGEVATALRNASEAILNRIPAQRQ
jgi:hypothetical protein